jgi:hypothetical protein
MTLEYQARQARVKVGFSKASASFIDLGLARQVVQTVFAAIGAGSICR